MTEEEQEKYIDEALKAVKAQAFHIHNTIERNNMRQCLRDTSQMLMELKTGQLTPKSYYNVYTVIFDEMQYVYNFFKEEARRGRRMFDLYDTVQQASNILPRLYLMITVGAVYIETDPKVSKEICYDLLGMVKGVQSPTRGLFTRYDLLKMVKDRVPDKGNEYVSETNTVKDTLQFILQNLEEMNRLWIRLSTGSIGNERLLREKERNELRILVGENIVRLSSMDGLDLDLYQMEILPKIVEILLESKDQLSQQYLMECIIHAFPDEYNIQCMKLILETMSKLTQGVDVISLYIALMDKLAKFVKELPKEESDALNAAEKIFNSLRESIDQLTETETSQVGGVTEPNKLIELQLAFMKFAIGSCPEKDKLDTINHILATSHSILNSYSKKLGQEGINLLRNLLTVPLESKLSLFDLKKYPELMIYLDFNSRTTLAIRIIESLSNKEKLDSTEKVNILLDFIRPLLEDSADTIEVDASQFEYEQNVVAKILFVISTNDPIKLLEILIAIIPVFSKGGNRRIKYTLPTLVNAFVRLGYQVSEAYEYKNHLNDQNENNTGVHQEFINYLDMTAFESDSFYEQYLTKIHTHINEIINMLIQPYPELSFKLYLTAAVQANSIRVEAEKFIEVMRAYISGALSIYQENEIEPKTKFQLLIDFMGTLLQIRSLPLELMAPFVTTLQQLSQGLVKRAEQCNAMLCCSTLYYHLLGNKEKANECLNKAKRFADFAMTNPDNLVLFVIIINKYLYFVEACKDDDCFIKTESVEDVIEIIRNHIQTIKTENTAQTNLSEIERYFESTMDVIKMRKNEKKHRFYEDLVL